MNALLKSVFATSILFFVFTSVHAQVGIGTSSPNISAQLDVYSTTKGFLPPRMTTADRSAISTAVAGLVVYNTTIGQLEYFNGTGWVALVAGNTPFYAQFRGNAAQTLNVAGGKVDFPTTLINVGGFTVNTNNTIVLPAGRVYRVDLNLGWAALSWGRFAIYNATTNTAISPTAHLEGANSLAFAGSGTVSTFINTTSGSISIDVRYVAPGGVNTLINDVNNGTNFTSITIQSVD